MLALGRSVGAVAARHVPRAAVASGASAGADAADAVAPASGGVGAAHDASSRVAVLEAMPTSEVFGAAFWNQRPFVVRGGSSHWRACSHWTLDYLAQRAASTTVPVEVGGNYLDPDTARLEMPLKAYLAYLGSLGDDEEPPRGSLAYLAQVLVRNTRRSCLLAS